MLLLNFDNDALVTTMCVAKITVDQRFADCVPAFCYGKLLRRDEVLAEALGDRLIALFVQINDVGFDPVKRKWAKVFGHWLLVILGYRCGRCWVSVSYTHLTLPTN